MKRMTSVGLCITLGWLTACTPIKTNITNQYQLTAFSTTKIAPKKTRLSLLVSQPDAIAGYQTEQMMYINKPFELNSFVHNAWVSSPANMLYPLMIQSLETSNFFFAIASGPDADKTDYRLDTQLFALQQNFLTKPSHLELVAKVVLTHIEDNRVVSSKIIKQHATCPSDTPLGGVFAANQATTAFTKAVTSFVIKQVQQDKN